MLTEIDKLLAVRVIGLPPDRGLLAGASAVESPSHLRGRNGCRCGWPCLAALLHEREREITDTQGGARVVRYQVAGRDADGAVSIEIALPRERVVQLLADPAHLPKRLRGLVLHEPLRGDQYSEEESDTDQ